MSEMRVGMNGVLVSNLSFKEEQRPVDPTTAAIDALRSAVVAQTALLRSLAEQVRTTSEMVCGVVWDVEKRLLIQFTGLAERLEKLDQQDDRFLVALEQVGNGHRARLAAIEAKLASPDAERIFTPEELKKLERDFKFKPLRTTRPAPKGAARRKAKR